MLFVYVLIYSPTRRKGIFATLTPCVSLAYNSNVPGTRGCASLYTATLRVVHKRVDDPVRHDLVTPIFIAPDYPSEHPPCLGGHPGGASGGVHCALLPAYIQSTGFFIVLYACALASTH